MSKILSCFIGGLFLVSCGLLEPNLSIRLESKTPGFELINGVLHKDGQRFNGSTYSNYPNGNPQKDASFKKGRKNGFEKRWFSNGDLAVERFYTDGVKTGLHRSWWKKNELKFVYHFNEHGQYHGTINEWYPDGQLAKQFNFVNGQEDGPQKLFKPDGKIKANYEVINGERYGLIGLKRCKTVTTENIN